MSSHQCPADDFAVIDMGATVPGLPWAVVHTPTGRIAPADPAAPWLEWAEGRVPLAYFPSRDAAAKWARELAATVGGASNGGES